MQRIWGSLIVILAALIAVEFSMRVIAADAYSIWPPEMRIQFTPLKEAMPGVEGVSRFSTNQLGIRGDELVGDETFRVLALGASTTLCANLDDSENWTHLLQSQLQETYPDERIWVGAAGRPGNTLRHNHLQLEHLLERMPAPDLVVMMVGGVELNKALGLGWGAGQSGRGEETMHEALSRSFAIRPKPLFDFSYSLVWESLETLVARVGDVAPVIQDQSGASIITARQKRAQADEYVSELPDLEASLALYEEELIGAIKDARSTGAEIVLMTQPSLYSEDLPPELESLIWGGRIPGNGDGLTRYYSVPALARGMRQFNEKLLSVCEDYLVTCIDLDPLLAKDTTVFLDASHFNESGAKRVAGILGDRIVNIGMEPDQQRASISDALPDS